LAISFVRRWSFRRFTFFFPLLSGWAVIAVARSACGSLAAPGAFPAVRAAGVGGNVLADEGQHGGERDGCDAPAATAASAARAALMLWTSSSAKASLRARAAYLPRRTRRAPRTVRLKWRNAVSTCRLAA
jgi:hypothetical protein